MTRYFIQIVQGNGGKREVRVMASDKIQAIKKVDSSLGYDDKITSVSTLWYNRSL